MNAIAQMLHEQMAPRFCAHLLTMEIDDAARQRTVHRWRYEGALTRTQHITMRGVRAVRTLTRALLHRMRAGGNGFCSDCDASIERTPGAAQRFGDTYTIHIELYFSITPACLARRAALEEDVLVNIVHAMAAGAINLYCLSATCRVTFGTIPAVAAVLPAPAQLPPALVAALVRLVTTRMPHYRLRYIDGAFLSFGLQEANAIADLPASLAIEAVA